jgi:mevalonate kinase
MRSASACGKCVLFGEYSILQGGTALTLPVKSLKFQIQFEANEANRLQLKNSEPNESIDELFWKLLENDFSDVNHCGSYTIESSIPLGAGLGSSAALCVALHRLHRPGIDPNKLIQLAWKSENVFHGKSSGMDPCTVALEKSLCFENPQNYSVLNENLLNDPNYIFLLFDSGIRRSTLTGISKLQTLREKNPDHWTKSVAQLQQFAHVGKILFEESKANALGAKMNEAHAVLKHWELSHPELEKLRDKLLSLGALGVKLTGAGRGGFLLALFDRSALGSLQSRKNASGIVNFFEIVS